MRKPYAPSAVKTQFSRPKYHTVRDTDKQKRSHEFFEYWKRLPKEHHDFVEVRTYRLWPAIDLKLVEPDRKSVEIEILYGLCPFEPEAYKEEFLHRYGSGEWRCVLTEKGVDGSVMEAYFSAIDMDRFPPVIDLRTLVVGAFANKEYIRGLQTRGVELPWEVPEELKIKRQEKEDEMGANEAIGTMASSLVEMAKANASKPDTQAPNEPSLESKAGAATIDMMAHATNGIVDMMTKNFGTQYNPVQILESAAKILRPEPGQGESESIRMLTMFMASMKESNELARSAQREQFEFMKSVTMGKNGDGSFGAVVPAQKPLIEQVKEMKEMSDLFGGFFGGGRRERSAPEPPAEPVKGFAVSLMENIGPITALVTTVGVLLGNMMYNWKLKDGEKPQSPQEAMNKSQSAAPQGAPAPQPQTGPPTAQQWVQWFHGQFANSFVEHLLGAETNGYTLAQLLITNGTMANESTQGRKMYLMLKENLGPEGLDTLVRGNVAVWQQCSGIPQKVKEFINEFFTYDEWLQEQNEPVAEAATAS